MTEQHTRRIIHIDMDAFFASVEQRDNPDYRGRPVVVGGSPEGRGVVAAASYEARVYGIRSAMSSHEAKKRCGSVIFVKPRFERYKEVSEQIMSLFREYTPLVEPLALDEAFLDVTDCVQTATEIGVVLRERIFKTLSLTASAGVSFNKFLAKCASEHCKPDGLFVIRPHNAEEFIYALPIERFPGVGPATAKKLQEAGVRDGRSLHEIPCERLISLLGKRGNSLFNLARGIDNRSVQTSRERRSLGVERTFDQDVASRDAMLLKLNELVGELYGKMSKKALYGRTLVLKARTPAFATRSFSYTIPSPHFIKTEPHIQAMATKLLDHYLVLGKPARLLGLMLKGIVEGDSREASQLVLKFNPT
jgi:DNA polymerase IV